MLVAPTGAVAEDTATRGVTRFPTELEVSNAIGNFKFAGELAPNGAADADDQELPADLAPNGADPLTA